MLATTEQVKQQPQGRTRIIRATVFPIDTIGQEKSFHFLRLVIAIQKLAQAAGQEGNQLCDLGAGNSPEALAGAQQVPPTVQAIDLELRWRLKKKGLEIAGQLLELIVDADERLGIARGKAAQHGHGSIAIRPPGGDLPVG